MFGFFAICGGRLGHAAYSEGSDGCVDDGREGGLSAASIGMLEWIKSTLAPIRRSIFGAAFFATALGVFVRGVCDLVVISILGNSVQKGRSYAIPSGTDWTRGTGTISQEPSISKQSARQTGDQRFRTTSHRNSSIFFLSRRTFFSAACRISSPSAFAAAAAS